MWGIVPTEMRKPLNCSCKFSKVFIDGVGSCNSFTCQVLHMHVLFFQLLLFIFVFVSRQTQRV